MMAFFLDPCGHYNHDADDIIKALGILPAFAGSFEGGSFIQYMADQYGLPLIELDGDVNDNMIFNYPGDEPQYPLCVAFDQLGNTAIFYPHSFVALIEVTEAAIRRIITRMD